MINKFRIFIAVVVMATSTITVQSQNGINSPYSRYGFGILSDKAMGFNKAMSGVSQGFRDGQIINSANPASYSAVDSLTALFDFGLSVYNGNYKMGNLQHNAKNSSFDYAAFHFRASKGFGIALGILPYSNINYNFSSNSKIMEGVEDNTTSSYKFNGDGGLHKVFLGAGWQITKPLSLGFNVSYLYGSYNHNMSMSFNESTINSINRKYNADISSYLIDLGIQYTININKKDKLVLGATFTPGHEINDNAYRTTQSINSLSGIISQTSDTITNAFELPNSVVVGATYYKDNRLSIGADFEMQKWSDVKFPAQDSENDIRYISQKGLLYDRYKISLGGSYTPNPNGNRYSQLLTYKVGGYYSKSYANADLTGKIADKPFEFGLSAGITIPIINSNIWYNSPKLNIALQWIHSNIPYMNSNSFKIDKLKENYLKLCISLTFSERWFYKSKLQ